MKSIFTQTAEHSTASSTCSQNLRNLPDLIRKHTGLDYAYVQTDTGCLLKPTFRNMPYRNSFVPEIDIMVSCNGTQTILQIQGQPVKFVRTFMVFWFGGLLLMEAFLLVLAAASNLDSLFLAFIPVIMCIFGYLLCKTATGITFQSVIKAIEKELK